MRSSEVLHPNSLCRNFLNFYPFLMKIIAIKFVNVCQRIHTRPWVKKISQGIFDLQNKNTPSKDFKPLKIFNFQSLTLQFSSPITTIGTFLMISQLCSFLFIFGGELKKLPPPPKMKACLITIVCFRQKRDRKARSKLCDLKARSKLCDLKARSKLCPGKARSKICFYFF